MSYILVTNDDGVRAPGIVALASAMRALGEVRVIAPATNQSASGHKNTLFQDIPIAETRKAGTSIHVSPGPAMVALCYSRTMMCFTFHDPG